MVTDSTKERSNTTIAPFLLLFMNPSPTQTQETNQTRQTDKQQENSRKKDKQQTD